MDGWMVALFVPTLAFICLVVPIWIFMHYRSKQRVQGELSAAEKEDLIMLSEQADSMLDRIDTLEAILDVETPGWRTRQGQEVNPKLKTKVGSR